MGILKTLDVEVSMYCSLLRRNIYNSEWYGGEGGDFYP